MKLVGDAICGGGSGGGGQMRQLRITILGQDNPEDGGEKRLGEGELKGGKRLTRDGEVEWSGCPSSPWRTWT
jgi:hypothetical protein